MLLALLCSCLAGVFSVTSPLDGTWVGTETCVDHCDTPGHHQGTVAATLSLTDGSGIYSVGGQHVHAEEFDGSFMRGNLTDVAGNRHGTVMLASADGKHAYGTFYSYTSMRLFHWEFNKTGPTPVPTPAPHAPGVTVYEDGLGGYACHRVPAVVNTGTSILVFVESRHKSCG